jgi:hypothetical protein
MPRLSPRHYCLIECPQIEVTQPLFFGKQLLVDAKDLTQDSSGRGAPAVITVSRGLTIPGVIPTYEPFTKSLARSTLVIT